MVFWTTYLVPIHCNVDRWAEKMRLLPKMRGKSPPLGTVQCVTTSCTVASCWRDHSCGRRTDMIYPSHERTLSLPPETTRHITSYPICQLFRTRKARIVITNYTILSQKIRYIDGSSAFLTSDDFIRSNEIIRTKWPTYVVIGHFVLMM